MQNGITLSSVPTHQTMQYSNSSSQNSNQIKNNNINKNITKKVKFNTDVEVYKVESYKEHNKKFCFREEEELNDLYEIENGKQFDPNSKSKFKNLKSSIIKNDTLNKNNNYNNYNSYNNNNDYFNNYQKSNKEKSDCCCIIF